MAHRSAHIVTAIVLVLLATVAPSLIGCSGDPNQPEVPMSSLDLLPPDAGGVQYAVPRNPELTDSAFYGYLVYLPDGMDQSPVPYPLLVFLHGSGERGDSYTTPGALFSVMGNGPPMLIAGHRWQSPHPMIVVSPQCHTSSWQADDLRLFLEWMADRYPIDRQRIYLTGLSMGGYGTWSYLGTYGATTDDPLPIAAAAPVCGGGDPGLAAGAVTTPVWAFHGTSDAVVPPSGSVELVKALGALDPSQPPRLTLYHGVGHDSWSGTYDGARLGEGLAQYPEDPAVEPWLVPYAPGLLEWMLEQTAAKNQVYR